jgi:5-methyltetrahydropteroyltriglutamate--homocysteine methyltransferase
MKHSTDRILTTHVGSLPRPEDMIDMLAAKFSGRPIDEQKLEARLPSAVAELVAQQVKTGLDVINDGEVGRPSFITYIDDRLTGFERREIAGKDAPRAVHYLAGSREYLAFPEYYEPEQVLQSVTGGRPAQEILCSGPITYKGHELLQRDIANFKTALKGAPMAEAFFPAVSPNQISYRRRNEYYRSDEEYETAIADALHEEYMAVVDAGLLVQVDDPQLVTHWVRNPDLTIEECRRWAARHVELLNHALRDIPRDRVRFHTCYSIGFGPRVHDMEFKDIIDIVLRINAGAHSFEAANVRHEHEWRLWEDAKLPEDTVLIPGVVTPSHATVEHPELVAERIERFARIVGRENVIAGVDCGFASTARSLEMPASIVWAKLNALVEGARIASARLWQSH